MKVIERNFAVDGQQISGYIHLCWFCYGHYGEVTAMNTYHLHALLFDTGSLINFITSFRKVYHKQMVLWPVSISDAEAIEPWGPIEKIPKSSKTKVETKFPLVFNIQHAFSSVVDGVAHITFSFEANKDELDKLKRFLKDINSRFAIVDQDGFAIYDRDPKTG